MKTEKLKNRDNYADALEFSQAAARRHLIMEDMQSMVFIINESEFGNKMRKINRYRQHLNTAKCGKRVLKCREMYRNAGC